MSDYFQSTGDIQGESSREAILLCGRYGSGKTCAEIALLKTAEDLTDSTSFVIDIEHKFKSALDAFGKDAPRKLHYRSVSDMNEATEAADKVVEIAKPGDWVCLETLPRFWQGSQDLAYQAVAGVTKVEFMERKRKDKTIKSPIPHPDDFWPIANGSQYGFLDTLIKRTDINLIMATTIKRAKTAAEEDRSKIKTSAERKTLRLELGVDFDIEGAPRAMSYVETICHLKMNGGSVDCNVLRDNLWRSDEELPSFEIPDRKSFGLQFFSTCRG